MLNLRRCTRPTARDPCIDSQLRGRNAVMRFTNVPVISLFILGLSTVGVTDLASAQSGDTKFGTNALENDMGSDNSAFGYNALQASTLSAGNTATGFLALYTTTTGG